MIVDPVSVRISPLTIQLSLLVLLVLQPMLVPIHHRVVRVSPILDLVRELRMFLSNFDLPLQSLLLVV